MNAVIMVLALMVIGLGLLVIEVLVIPGLGLVGMLGVAGVVASCVIAYTQLSTTAAVLTIAGGVVSAAVVFWLLPRTRVGKSMVLETQTLGRAANPALRALVGIEGVSLTPLRPSGSARLEDRPIDVVTDGEYVESGKRVVVVKVEGSRVVVSALD